ncbi:MAG: T9SS type A sorting domain-containing protein [Bacteroidetes bacterium]|nr:T9SS type A sorting domain-containing protein [Bacteroidota bacterium]
MRKLILLACLFLLSANLHLSAQQDWYWKSPNPQGNRINQIFTGNNKLFGIGECSTVISTSNAGASWNVINRLTGPEDNITAFQKYDENTYYLGTKYNGMRKTTNGGVNWTGISVIYESSSTGIRGIAFTSASIGYVITYKNIYKTTNGGSSPWNLLTTLPDELTSINFIDNNTGFVTTMGGMEGGVSTLYKTTNGGLNWTSQIFNGWAGNFRILKFVNANTGFIQYGGFANGSRLYKTTNQGLNWTITGTSEVFGRIFIFDENNIAGTDYNDFKSSTDGGATWIIKTQPYLEPIDLYFESIQKGYVLDKNNRISITQNSGDNWAQITEPNGNGSASDVLKVIDFVNNNTGYIAGRNNKIKETTNGGETWTEYETGLEGVSGVDFLDVNTGFVSGNSAWHVYVSKTTNGGASFTPAYVSDDYIGTKVKFANVNTGFVYGYYKFFGTTNGGVNWQAVTLQDDLDIYSIQFINENTGMLCGRVNQSFVNKVYRTTNSGASWIPVYSTPNSLGNTLYKIKMVNDTKGYICGYGISTTTNGGANWYQLYITGIPQGTFISSMDFINEQTGYAAGTGVTYKTTDGGSHWGTGSIPTQARIEDIKFFNASTGIIVGDFGVNLKTTNGGGIFVSAITQVGNSVVSDYQLHQNFPNPFNPVTNIQFDIPKGDFVDLKVYDILGKEIENLVSEFKSAGSYMVTFDASRFGSGVFFYRMKTNGFIQTKRMVIVK